MSSKAIMGFWQSDSGAVTVDWTVLAASVVGLGIASVAAVRVGTSALGDDIMNSLSSASVFALSYVADFAMPDLSQGAAIWAMGWGFDTSSDYDLNGWTRTAGLGGRVQFIRDGYMGVHSGSGDYMMDMGHYGNVALKRTVDLAAGETAFLQFNVVDPRNGNNGNGLDVYYGGQLIESIDPGAGPSRPYSIELIGGTGDGSNTLELRSRQATHDVLGVWIDNVTVR